ncbi:MAG: gamma-glutamyltransferase family protein, partial [Bacteroidota bacterium]
MRSRFILLALTCLLALPTQAQDRITGLPFATRSEVIAKHGMAATSQPLATQVALDILKAGGTAIDAAIAANACLGLMEPTGCGVGGDLFAIVWDSKSGQLHGYNGSGTAPSGLTLKEFAKKGHASVPAFGPLPVTIPGTVDGWFALHKRFGKLPMEVILAPAIAYAREGFPVSELIAYYLQRSSVRFRDYPNFAETYMPDGKPLQKGQVFQNPRLAYTLELIAEKGRKAFYKGEIAKKIAAHMKDVDGYITLDDLKQYEGEWVEPVSTNYRGYDVWELPPNGQGIAALQILNILEPYDLKAMGFNSAEYIHTFTEAKKLAFEDRAKFYADMKFADVPVEQLISKAYANERRKLINPNRASRRLEAGKLEDGDTIYLTVADKDGNMVSFIQSNYMGMGSGV